MLCLACAAQALASVQGGIPLSRGSSGRTVPELIQALQTVPGDQVPAIESELLTVGPDAVSPIVQLIAANRGKERGMGLLARMGARAVPPLVALLEDDELRPTAARALAHAVGTETAGSADRLLDCVARGLEVKHFCGMALVRGMSPRQASRAPLLAAGLKSADRNIRLYAALGLKQIGLKAAGVREALSAAYDDPDAEVRQVVRSTGVKPAPKKGEAKR